MKFSGKKILFLHSGAINIPFVERAKELGCRTIVANSYPVERAPAKRVADEHVEIDFSDTEAMVAMMKERHVDGIVTGYADSHLPYYYRLCKAMGFPCYCTEEQIELTTNKLKFKELCRAHGVPTVKEYRVSPNPTREELDAVEYPVMVKPADSSGARGCRPCWNEEELLRGIRDALSYSKAGEIIVEKYMDRKSCDDVTLHYVFSHGTAYLINVDDRYTNMEQKGFAPITSALIYPSLYTQELLCNLVQPLQKMFSSAGINDGKAFVQAFYDEEGFHCYEMGFRLGGGQAWIPFLAETGINILEAMLCFAITGDSCYGEALHNITPLCKYHYCNFHFLCSEGRISNISGLEKLKHNPSVMRITQIHFPGDYIKADGSLGQVLCRVFVQSPSRNELMAKIKELRTNIVAYDENNQPMMLHAFNPDDIGTGNC